MIKDFKKVKLPVSPGVYFFWSGKKIIYIGKATSLRDRVRSYFSKDIERMRGLRIKNMIEEITAITFEKTDSVLEALILENNLIKKHKPKYNVKEKDDKSYYYVVVTKEDFPRILLLRGREMMLGIDPGFVKKSFGPFPKSSEIREGLKIIRKIFPYRDKCKPNSGKACFNHQIGLCPGVCVGVVSKTEYTKTIRNIVLFLEGKKKMVMKRLDLEMKKEAQHKNFEMAKVYRNQLFALRHIQDVSLIKSDIGSSEGDFKIEAFDIAHMSGRDTVGVMAVVVDGEISKESYRRFLLKGFQAKDNNDIANLRELLERRLRHKEWTVPSLIVLDGGQAHINLGKKVLRDMKLNIALVSVVKDEYHRPKKILGQEEIILKYEKEILLANFSAHRFAINYHRQKRDKII